MTSTETDTRYPRAAIAAAITEALAGSDYAHTAEWTAPPECRCRRENLTCLTVQAQQCLTGAAECQGYIVHIPVSPGKALTPDQLISVLPEPWSDGTVSGSEAAAALQALILDRLSWNPYWVASLAKRLEKAFTELEDTGAPDNRQDAVPVSVLTCQWCQGPIPLARGKNARYCRNSHRVSAHRAAKREQERPG